MHSIVGWRKCRLYHSIFEHIATGTTVVASLEHWLNVEKRTTARKTSNTTVVQSLTVDKSTRFDGRVGNDNSTRVNTKEAATG